MLLFFEPEKSPPIFRVVLATVSLVDVDLFRVRFILEFVVEGVDDALVCFLPDDTLVLDEHLFSVDLVSIGEERCLDYCDKLSVVFFERGDDNQVRAGLDFGDLPVSDMFAAGFDISVISQRLKYVDD